MDIPPGRVSGRGASSPLLRDLCSRLRDRPDGRNTPGAQLHRENVASGPCSRTRFPGVTFDPVALPEGSYRLEALMTGVNTR
jgi:hypothetical protein